VTSWGNNAMLCYEGCNVGENASQLRFCQEGGLEALDCEYAKLGYGGRHQFGCVSMRKTPYCILNKAYSESEYKALRERIIEQMNTLHLLTLSALRIPMASSSRWSFRRFPITSRWRTISSHSRRMRRLKGGLRGALMNRRSIRSRYLPLNCRIILKTSTKKYCRR